VDSVAFVADFPIVGNATERRNDLRSNVIMSDHSIAGHCIALHWIGEDADSFKKARES
jgi:hypothetical protein